MLLPQQEAWGGGVAHVSVCACVSVSVAVCMSGLGMLSATTDPVHSRLGLSDSTGGLTSLGNVWELQQAPLL